tara:strand:- start:7792 stop:7971 length:180 start_codon:yes stop_codon:yes gene_type:complete
MEKPTYFPIGTRVLGKRAEYRIQELLFLSQEFSLRNDDLLMQIAELLERLYGRLRRPHW